MPEPTICIRRTCKHCARETENRVKSVRSSRNPNSSRPGMVAEYVCRRCSQPYRAEMDLFDEGRYRIECTRAAVGEGAGDRHSLDNFNACLVEPRARKLAPLVSEFFDKADKRPADPDVIDLVQEHYRLLNLSIEILTALANPSVVGVDLRAKPPENPGKA